MLHILWSRAGASFSCVCGIFFYFLGSLPIEELLTLDMKSIQASFNECATRFMCFTPSVNN